MSTQSPRHATPSSAELTDAERSLVHIALPDAVGAEVLIRTERGALIRVMSSDNAWYLLKSMSPQEATNANNTAKTFTDGSGFNPLLKAGFYPYGYLLYRYAPLTLSDQITRWAAVGKVSLLEVADILGPVATALGQLEELGLVHGDMKPNNIVIHENASAVLSDLDQMIVVGTPAVRCTPGYCSPQQLGHGHLTTHADDRYGFASTLATVLTLGTAWMDDPRFVLPHLLGRSLAQQLLVNLADDPNARTLNPTQLLLAIGEHAKLTPTVPIIDLALANEPRPASLPTTVTWTDLTTAPQDSLLAAASEVFGNVSLDAPTIDRIPLQQDTDETVQDEPPEKSVWRRPAMLVSLLATFLAVVGTLVWLLV